MWGACLGSFLNVVFYRYPLGLSVVRPGSACPNCKTPIAAYDNVPVLAWLWLRGSCRHCKAPISIRYPIYEACFGLLFALPYFVHKEPITGLSLALWSLCAVAILVLLLRCARAPIYLWIGLVGGLAVYLFKLIHGIDM
ncbi:MAG: prepilin peptidase [Acidobacteria bacterium]|nr:prepilin peptidase [Acidobacteriota bacterium]